MESTQVVIVGGGVAGLAAAKTLGRDVNYVIIEAQNYLGGRILTVDAGKLRIGCAVVFGRSYTSVFVSLGFYSSCFFLLNDYQHRI
jgi:monoamine oxidase